MGSSTTALKMLLKPYYSSGTQLLPDYERAFAQNVVGADVPTLAFGRGRVALWSILNAISVNDGFEVIVPAYTCETVPMAVKFAGARCVYADVETGHYNVSLRGVGQVLTQDTRAIICQHTYGFRQPVRDWIQWTSKQGMFLIEDRCQLIANGFNKDTALTLGDAAYFSTHFSKPFSTAQGGMAAFSNIELYAHVKKVRDSFPKSPQRARSLALQMLLYSVTVRPSTRALVGSIFRWAQRSGLIRGTVSHDEYGGVMPDDYLLSASNFHAVVGTQELFRWHDNIQHRQRLTRYYLDCLDSLGVITDNFRNKDNAPILLMVPILVTNKEQILRRAARSALPIGTWFDRCPAHLDQQTAHQYDYRPGQCPNAEYLVSKEIHLLTAPWVSLHQAKRAVRFLEKYAHWASH
jgi:perosamine synthetase